MARWTLQSDAGSAWMFHPGERRIQGFRSTHQLSPWLSDYGYATFLPFCGEINPEPSERASSYCPEDATLAPHSLRLHLMRYGIDAELIPTDRCSLIRAFFTKPDIPGFLFDIPGTHAPDIHEDATQRTISFTSTANAGGVPEGFATYYVLRFAEPWKSFAVTEMKDRHTALLRFSSEVRSLDVRIAQSFISFEQARRNLENELGTASADALREQGKDLWNKHLLRIEIEGATPRPAEDFLLLPLSHAALSSHLARTRLCESHAAPQSLHWSSHSRGHVCRSRLLGRIPRVVSAHEHPLPGAPRRNPAGLGERL